MEFPELVQELCLRPGMWVMKPYFTSVCGYITGYNDARDGGPLAGWREWLIVRNGGGNHVAWEGLVRVIIPSEANPSDPAYPPTDDADQAHVRAMAALFAEFFRDREAMGVAKIYHDYAKWLLRKRWYDGPLRKKRG